MTKYSRDKNGIKEYHNIISILHFFIGTFYMNTGCNLHFIFEGKGYNNLYKKPVLVPTTKAHKLKSKHMKVINLDIRSDILSVIMNFTMMTDQIAIRMICNIYNIKLK